MRSVGRLKLEPVAIVVELVVAGQSEQGAETGTERKKGLCGGVDPDLK